MARSAPTAAMSAASVLALIAVLLGALLGREAIPAREETTSQYMRRILARGQAAVEDWYVQALLQLPGAPQAVVVDPDRGASKGPSPSSKKTNHDQLKQNVAKDEGAINAQQEVHARRYAEAKKELGDKIIIPETPDDVRERMPSIDPSGPEMRCGQPILPHSSLITRDIELRAKATYQGERGDSHAWKYVLTFVNRGKETVQMLTRHWVFVDGEGHLEEVKGPGARGVTPVLPPGAEWNYESGTSLTTAYGSMYGSFQFEVLKGDTSLGKRSFSARVGRLLLTSQGQSARKVPCADPATVGRLSLTSVMSVDRVILGGRAEYQGRKKKDGKKYYRFTYDIQINNARAEPIDVVAHTWEVVDADGQRHIVDKGNGVGGTFVSRPRNLAAGDAFRVQGELLTTTPEANALGTYQVIIKTEDGTFGEIEARTDWMGLAAERSTTHVPNFVADPIFR